LDANNNYLGMATIIDKKNVVQYKGKTTIVRNPSGKIMLAEECVTTADTPAGVPASATIDDGRFEMEPPGQTTGSTDYLTTRHGQKGTVDFADSHAEEITWQFATNIANSLPSY
jgi:hypothetical protein